MNSAVYLLITVVVEMMTPSYLFEILGLQDVAPSLYVEYDGVGSDLGRVRRPEMLVSLKVNDYINCGTKMSEKCIECG